MTSAYCYDIAGKHAMRVHADGGTETTVDVTVFPEPRTMTRKQVTKEEFNAFLDKIGDANLYCSVARMCYPPVQFYYDTRSPERGTGKNIVAAIDLNSVMDEKSPDVYYIEEANLT